VPGLEGVLLPPPQPMREREKEANNNPQLSTRNSRFQRLILAGTKARPKTPARARPPAGIHGLDGGLDGPKGRTGLSMAVAAAVVTVNVLETGELPEGVTLAGENEQVTRLGSVPQENFTVPAYPPSGVTVKVNVALWPGVTDPDVGVAATVKSGAAITIVTGLEVLAELFASPW
jgi:hypothetical protein